jgi:hypothetical protein
LIQRDQLLIGSKVLEHTSIPDDVKGGAYLDCEDRSLQEFRASTVSKHGTAQGQCLVSDIHANDVRALLMQSLTDSTTSTTGLTHGLAFE